MTKLYERLRRADLKEEWHLRGRLRSIFVEDRIDSLERILLHSEEVLKGRKRMLRRYRIDRQPYLLKVYRVSGLRGGSIRKLALEQLETGMLAVGLGIDVVPVEAACICSPWVCLFVPEQEGWDNLSIVLNDPGTPPTRKWRVLEAFARFLRRLHDEGFYQPDQGLARFQVRMRASSQDFQLEDLEGGLFYESLPDEAREDMLGAILSSYSDGLTNGMRFLRWYADSEEVARAVAPRIMKDLKKRVRPPRPKKKKKRKPRFGKLSVDPFDIVYIKKDPEGGIEPDDLLRLYEDGLRAPGLRVVRTKNARTAWKAAMDRETPGEATPLACFTRKKEKIGFLLYRKASGT